MRATKRLLYILSTTFLVLLLACGAATAQSGCPADYPVDCGNNRDCCPAATVCCVQQNAAYTGCCSEEYPYCTAFSCYSSPPGPCALTYLAAGDPQTLQLMRSFRDTILMNSVAGRKHVALFYEHSPEVVLIIAANAEIREQAEYLLSNVMPDVLASLDANKVVLSDDVAKDIASLCKAISSKARPGLQRAIAMLMQDLAAGSL